MPTLTKRKLQSLYDFWPKQITEGGHGEELRVDNYIIAHKHDYGLALNSECQIPSAKIKHNLYLISLLCIMHYNDEWD